MKKKPQRPPAADKKPTDAPGDPGPVILRCRQCGAALTSALRRVPDPRPLTLMDGVDALPRGFFWQAPGQHEVWQGTEPCSLVVNRDDVVGLSGVGDRSGCCGPSGANGPNLACPAGHRVATEVADCWTPRMVVFGPSAAQSVAGGEEGTGGRVLTVGEAGPILSEEAFVAWAHGALEATGWHGNDVAALVREWLERTEASGETVCIVWLRSDASVRAGVPVGAIEAAIEQAQQGARRRRVALRLLASAQEM